jgi:hypothetical protein
VSDLATLFARNPLELTRTDIDTIVAEMRKSRHAFNLGNMKAGSTKPLSPKQKELKSLGDSLNINI